MLALALALGWGMTGLVDAGGRMLGSGFRLFRPPRAGIVVSLGSSTATKVWSGVALDVAVSVGFVTVVFAAGFVVSAVRVHVHHGRRKRDGRVSSGTGHAQSSRWSAVAMAVVGAASVGVFASAARAAVAPAAGLLPLVTGWLVVVAGALGVWIVGRGALRHRDRGRRDRAHDPPRGTD